MKEICLYVKWHAGHLDFFGIFWVSGLRPAIPIDLLRYRALSVFPLEILSNKDFLSPLDPSPFNEFYGTI